MIYIGIDPGISGACCVIGKDRAIAFIDTPIVTMKVGKSMKNSLDASACADIIANIMIESNGECYAIIEKVQAMPGKPHNKMGALIENLEQRSMGATSAFNFGKGFGIWLGILAAFKMPFEQVHPATWKRQLMQGMNTDADAPNSARKNAARIRAIELYPRVAKQLNLKKHHGRADALLLAEFGRRTYFGPEAAKPSNIGRTMELF